MPDDRDAGASDGGGFDMFLQLEGEVVEFALFQQRMLVLSNCKGFGVQGLVAEARWRRGRAASRSSSSSPSAVP